MTHRTTLTGRYPASRRLRTTGVAQWSATVVIEQASEARVTTEELRGCHAVGVPGRFAARRLIRTHGLAASKLIAEWCGVHLQAVTCTCIAATVLVASARRIFSCKIHAGDGRSYAAKIRAEDWRRAAFDWIDRRDHARKIKEEDDEINEMRETLKK